MLQGRTSEERAYRGTTFWIRGHTQGFCFLQIYAKIVMKPNKKGVSTLKKSVLILNPNAVNNVAMAELFSFHYHGKVRVFAPKDEEQMRWILTGQNIGVVLLHANYLGHGCIQRNMCIIESIKPDVPIIGVFTTSETEKDFVGTLIEKLWCDTSSIETLWPLLPDLNQKSGANQEVKI